MAVFNITFVDNFVDFINFERSNNYEKSKMSALWAEIPQIGSKSNKTYNL